eukprot:CAMPEP_0181200306 /NCGR_PEP_ID=MMETSP1096-20121128/17687_1 /TAXON_ID=156174 ORGANISM="Chrysochromulina ericina, Strain CCMP281" /NCGR_SAMPLE_ID=MMETSP1096 /ASSEMBLY_ACC=CAM_ASM_000453 /LENGTH=129 /DNA_ID=CAMNT_0023290641 /DNA_START=270 /DNA_END=655 /DNA_ORIENTATION=+
MSPHKGNITGPVGDTGRGKAEGDQHKQGLHLTAHAACTTSAARVRRQRTKPSRASLSHPPRLALPLQQHENVTLPNRPLHIAHNATRRVVKELDTDLDDVTGLAGAPQDLGNLRELYGLIHLSRFSDVT